VIPAPTEVLFASNTGLAVHVVRKLVPVLRELGVDLDDARQQAFLGLWHAARNYRSEAGSFAAYAVPCIRGYVLMAQRRRLRESLLAAGDEDADALDSLSRSREAPPQAAAERSECVAAVRAALEALTPGDAAVMQALLMHEEGQHDVARQLGVSRTRVQQRWSRALPKLREALAPHGERRRHIA
jgi:RNA polymerase sigma factor (sigma-70 family)